MIKCCCIKCHNEYSVKGIYTHYDRSHGSKEIKAKYSDGYNGKYDDPYYKEKVKNTKLQSFDKKLGSILEFKVSCNKCYKEFSVFEREKKFPTKEKYFCSLTCANTKIHSSLTKIKISKSCKLYAERNKKPPIIYTIICKGCNLEFISTHKRKTCSRTCRNKWTQLTSASNPNCGGKRNSHRQYYIMKDGTKVILDSTYERKVAEILDEHNTNWVRPKYFNYTDLKGIQRRYYPDFFLPDYKLYLDPKNDYLIKIDSGKIRLVMEQNDITILVLSKSQLNWDYISGFIS